MSSHDPTRSGSTWRLVALLALALAAFVGVHRFAPGRIAVLAAALAGAIALHVSAGTTHPGRRHAAAALLATFVLGTALDYALHPASNSPKFAFGLLVLASLAAFLALVPLSSASRLARPARIGARLGLVVASLGVAGLAGEWATLRFFPSILHAIVPFEDSAGPDLYRPDAELVHAHVPGFRGRFVHPEYGGERFEVNAEGWRDAPWPDRWPEGETRVIVLGDSMTVGYGVEREETIAASLEAALRDRRAGIQARALNAGVAGYGPRHERIVLERLLPRVRPTHVVVVFFDGNDLDDCRRHERRVGSAAFQGGGAPPEERASGGASDPYTAAAEAEMRDATLFDAQYWFKYSALFRRAGASIVARLARLGVRPPRYYYTYYEYKMLRSMQRTPEPGVEEEYALAMEALRAMDADCRAAGAKLLVVRLPCAVQTVPPTFESWHREGGRDPALFDRTLPGRRIVEECAAAGIATLDLLPKLEIADPVPSPWFWQEGHPNRKGNQAIARWIAEALEP